MNKNKIIYYIGTVVLSIVVLFSVSMYFFKHDMIKGAFTSLGYPTYLIYPYAILKLLGLVAVWTPSFKILKEWAYAGFFYAFVLAFFAHVMVEDGAQGTAVLAIIALVVSYIFNRLKNKQVIKTDN
ncbi:DoxX family protein [Algibacter sp. AS12]|uniref:DoxX family protein n=1 Tax=Algibacter sp. AS12 TaxID=3135773 RepID=UPI00398B1ABE